MSACTSIFTPCCSLSAPAALTLPFSLYLFRYHILTYCTSCRRYDLGLIGGAILGISNAFHISNATKEAIVGATKLGAFFGTFLGGVAMLRYGRRKAIGLQAAFFVSGPVIMAAATGPA